ncbi:MAG: N-acetyl-gamma-glutamyl-phosphate reductase [Gammaproteobacteria bacterium]|nr:N-acetyl-gamma-glutamyl-phosphate reductase [Gammaproteobacteria bacterium]MDH5727576.1 N-acetyl-gamma-glutamyl-phosphate reductase [Gammaproteobacteria bacterium]
MMKVGIVGGTGYTGAELLRILVSHPEVEVSVITSRGEAGKPVADLFPNLRGYLDICFSEPTLEVLSQCELIFFATPNGVAMTQVPELLAAGCKVIDLAADFRLQDPDVWKHWYGIAHACPELLEEAVYGLCEVNREQIKHARLVGNPGCYPTAVQLGFLPLLEQGLVDEQRLIADTKSGVSGAGRNAKTDLLLCEASENFKAYAVAGHRHWPEIKQGLSAKVNKAVDLTFVPHLTPMIRGIHATLYAPLKINEAVNLQDIYQQYYKNEFFVDVLPEGSHPETRSVRASNHCRIAVHRPHNGELVVILSVIDNLVKGAAGQAVQNMNIMCGFDERAGLTNAPLLP